MSICGSRADSCCLCPSQPSDLNPLEWQGHLRISMKLRAATVVEVKEAFKVGKCVDYKLIYSFLCVPSDLKSHIPLYFFFIQSL